MELGRSVGLRETGMKICPCLLFPHACYFLLTQLEKLSGPLNLSVFISQILFSVSLM